MKNLRLLTLGLLIALYGSSHATASGPLSLAFEENRGQGPAGAPFLARGQGYNIVLNHGGNHVLLRHAGRDVSIATRLVDANREAAIRGEEKQAGKVHYIRRNSSLTDIPTYARVRYERIYPGIDLVYYGNQQRLEYDFIVSPGADANRIALRFEGVDHLSIDSQGDLVLRAGDSEVVQHRPVVYQGSGNSRREIDATYRLLDADTVAFKVGEYDRGKTLVIDPILSYSTFLGGSNGDDDARAVTTDTAGNIYITGSTTSTNFLTAFPLQPNARSQDPGSGVSDAFVTKINPSGTSLIYSTYFGGTSDDDANAIAVDVFGNVLIGGSTASPDFPTSDGALRRTCNASPSGCFDAFIVKISSSGSAIIFASYVGGTGDDEARGVAYDQFGNTYIAGRTDSADFMTTAGVYSTDPAAGGFLMKFSPVGTIFYSTYVNTILGPADPRGLAVDRDGNAYIVGGTTTSGTSTGTDAFILKLNPSGTGLVYTQFLRAGKDEVGNGIAVDAGGNVYVGGETSSMNFPATSGAIQSRFGGGPAFRSSDAGTNWTVGSTGLTRTSLQALAVAPGGGTIFAGADDETAGGVFRSIDGGNSWISSASGIADSRVHALAVDPATPTTVYAGSRTLGVYKSTNGGSTWTATSLNNVFVTALAVDPATPTIVYAGTDAGGIYKTINGGTSWFAVNSGLATSSVRTIVVDVNAPATIYAATSAGIYKSSNAGVTWVASSSGLFDPDVNALVIDPRNSNLIFAGTNSAGVFRSSNGGGLWTASNGGLTGPTGAVSVTAMTMDRTSGTIYAAAGESNAVRVYKSANGTSWSPTSLATARMTGLAVDSNSVYAITVGGTDAFLAKWNASGSLLYASYLGGYRNDAANAVAADSSGGMYVAGSTSSTNFPILNPLQATFGGGSDVVSDAFVAKVTPTGSGLDFSTYLGGTSNDFGKGIAVDASNTTYVVGVTASTDFFTSAALQPSRPGLLDAFVVKMGEGSATSYAVPIRGAFSAASQGIPSNTTVGYARIQSLSGGSFPSGLAIFGVRQNNVLVSEAAVPASTPILGGRIYAEVSGGVNTGIAMANPNGLPAIVTYYFTDRNGQNTAPSTFTIPENGQTAAFLNQAPFNGGTNLFGTFSFSSSQPVAVIALRGFSNERGEFLITTLPVADLAVIADTEPILFPHYADGSGWTTQILLINTTDSTLAGSVQFSGLSSTNYSIPPRSSSKVATTGATPGILTGSVRVQPDSGSRAPVGVAVFSFKNGGVTVSEAGVPSLRPASVVRLYVESSGSAEQVGSIQSGIALANPSGTATLVTFELRTATGVSTGLTGSAVLPGNGQMAMFLSQIPGFAGLPNPFQGLLRVSSASGPIAVVGLRGRYNERRDFLITTTTPANESIPLVLTEQFFPHFADGGGYTTQFILFNGSIDQASSGLIRFYGQSGQSVSLGVR